VQEGRRDHIVEATNIGPRSPGSRGPSSATPVHAAVMSLDPQRRQAPGSGFSEQYDAQADEAE